MFKRMNLNARLIGVLLLVGLLPSIGIGAYMYLRSHAAMVGEIDAQITQIGANAIYTFETYLRTATNQASALARTRDVYQSLNILRASNGSQSSAAWQERLGVLSDSMPAVGQLNNYAAVNVIGTDGVLVYSTDATLTGANISTRDYFKGAMQGRVTTSEVFFSQFTNANTIAVGIPVYSQGGTGDIVGVFSIVIPTSYMEAQFSGAAESLGASGDVYMINRDGVLLTTPHQDDTAKVLETRINSEMTEKLTAAIRSQDTKYVSSLDTYLDYRGTSVVGMSGVFSLGGHLVGLIVEIDENEAMAAVNGMRNTMLVSCALVAIAIAAFGWYFARSISRPILHAVNGLSQGSDQVSAASVQLASSSQQLASGNAQQASAVQETSATLEETSSMIVQNSENTRQAASLSGQAKEAAEKGNAEMQGMMVSMAELKKSSDQIAKIIKVIDNIAFQTNILALNAAVEAARAGDAGMGFAVVAEEVRNLAQRSAQAASDTASIIETNIELSQQGVDGARRVGDSLGEIALLSKKVNELVDEVAAASQEQAQGISQVNRAIAQIEQATQENAASSEESATASEQLNSQSAAMKEIVNDLVRLVNGARANAAAFARNRKAEVSTARTVQEKQRTTIIKPNAAKSSSKKNINPEDVIPLEDDSQF